MGRQDVSSHGFVGSALVAVVVVAAALWKLTAARGSTLAELPPTTALVSYALVMGAAASVYFHWRLSCDTDAGGWDRRLSAWLVIGMTVGAVHGFLGGFVQQASSDVAAPGVDSWLLISQVVATMLLVVITRASERLDLERDPALVGFVGGLTLVAATCLAMVAAPSLRFGAGTAALCGAALMLSGLALAWNLMRHPQVSLWVRRRLAFSAVALVVAQCASHVAGAPFALTAIVASSAGALVLCALSVRLLRGTIRDHQERVRLLHSQIIEIEVAALEHRELLHEVGSTVAGIATASSVIDLRPELSGPPRARLERMMAAEVARLVRLMSDRSLVEPDRDVAVDEVVEPLVVSHQARGLDVHWTGSGLVARGNADDLAEVVNILLENAARHGSGQVRVSAAPDADMVEIRCSDQGTGIAPEVLETLFESGTKGQDSPGQGLGLAIAHRLMSQRGGTLEVVKRSPGATFVARLPRIGTARAALDHAS